MYLKQSFDMSIDFLVRFRTAIVETDAIGFVIVVSSQATLKNEKYLN